MADEKKIIEEVSGAVVKLTEVFKGLQEVINGNLTQQEQLIQYMTELKDAIGSSKELKDFVKVSAEMQKTQQALAKTQSDAIKIQQEAEKLRQQEIKTQQATTNALKAEEQQKQAIIRTEEASARQKNRLAKEAEKATRESEKAKSAYQRESARLLELTKRAKDAAIQYGVNSKQAKSLRQEQQKLDKSIKAVDSSLGIHNRNVGNYGSALNGVKGFLGQFGVALGGAQIAMKVFNGVIESSQIAGDGWAVIVGGMEGALDAFYRMLGTGDWSNFFKNLRDGKKAGEDFAKALDDLTEGDWSLKINVANLDLEIAKLNKKLREATASKDWKTVIEVADLIDEKELQKLDLTLSEAARKYTAFKNKINSDLGFEDDELVGFLKGYRVNEDLMKQAEEYTKTLEFYETRLSAQEGLGIFGDAKRIEAAKENIKDLRDSTDDNVLAMVKMMKQYGGSTDEMLAKLVDSYTALTEAEKSTVSATTRSNSARARAEEYMNREGIAIDSVTSKVADLIQIQEALLKQAREMPGRTEREVASRNNKIKIIELEIKRLKELGSIRKAEADLNIESIIKDEEDNAKDLEAIDQRGIDAYLDAEIEKTNILRRALQERQELEKEAARSAYNLQKAVVSAIFEAKSEKYEKDLEENAKYYDGLLSNELLSQEQRALIEAERTAKENDIREAQRSNEKKQFLFEQAMKVGEIVMNTSLAIAKTTAAYAAIPGGALIAAPIIGLIKANAALQIGTVLAQSIPKFAKGTINAPEGLAMVGERGTELKITPKGEASFTPSTASLDYLEKGTKIIPNHELVDMINRYSTASIVSEGAPVSNNDILIANALLELKKENKNNNDKLLKALSKETSTKDKSIDRMRKNALQNKIEGKNLYN